MKIQPCWYCGAEPTRVTKYFLDVEWTALNCCTTGSYSPHEEHTVDSWNRQQKALELLRTVERLSHLGRVRFGAQEGGYNAAVVDRRYGLDPVAPGENAADALINLMAWIDKSR